ncbi:hypothetical protein [Klebsiella oxytoca]|uniref:hypothetical protein n=1 Tax=Klebsiella oxytoca TaxID=571 RepID=UPI003879AB09
MHSLTASINSWPKYDYYFKLGVDEIIDELNELNIPESYTFINLNRNSLTEFLKITQDMNENTYEFYDKTIIIASPRLLTLADYYFSNHKQICAFFSSSVQKDELVSNLSMIYLNSEFNPPVIQPSRRFYQRDISILESFLLTKDPASVKKRFNVATSTIYRWRAVVAWKLGVNKLEHVLLKE